MPLFAMQHSSQLLQVSQVYTGTFRHYAGISEAPPPLYGLLNPHRGPRAAQRFLL